MASGPGEIVEMDAARFWDIPGDWCPRLMPRKAVSWSPWNDVNLPNYPASFLFLEGEAKVHIEIWLKQKNNNSNVYKLNMMIFDDATCLEKFPPNLVGHTWSHYITDTSLTICLYAAKYINVKHLKCVEKGPKQFWDTLMSFLLFESFSLFFSLSMFGCVCKQATLSRLPCWTCH